MMMTTAALEVLSASISLAALAVTLRWWLPPATVLLARGVDYRGTLLGLAALVAIVVMALHGVTSELAYGAAAAVPSGHALRQGWAAQAGRGKAPPTDTPTSPGVRP